MTVAHVLPRNVVQIAEQNRKKNQSSSITCKGLMKYSVSVSVSVSTEMRVLVLYSSCKNVVSVLFKKKGVVVNIRRSREHFY